MLAGALEKYGLDAILAKGAVKNKIQKVARSIVKGGIEAGTEYVEELVSAATQAAAEAGVTDSEIGNKMFSAVQEASKNIDVMVGAAMAGGGVSFSQTKGEIL